MKKIKFCYRGIKGKSGGIIIFKKISDVGFRVKYIMWSWV